MLHVFADTLSTTFTPLVGLSSKSIILSYVSPSVNVFAIAGVKICYPINEHCVVRWMVIDFSLILIWLSSPIPGDDPLSGVVIVN
jgi:hypothetical protein